jgi:hypothetical protein
VISLQKLEAARTSLVSGGHDQKSIGVVIKAMPSAVRRMGLVRSLEWLEAGQKNAQVGQALHRAVAPLLLLDIKISRAVQELETCDRRVLFGYHRRAIEVFDMLAILHRAEEATS